MIKNLFRSLIVIVSLMFGGCHDPVEKKDQDPKGDGEITVEERMTALDRCEAKANEHNNLVSPEDRIQMLTWLTTQPEFAMAGFAGEQLFAVFTRTTGSCFFCTLRWTKQAVELRQMDETQ